VLEHYRFLRDELGAEYIQFIPIIERVNDDGSTLIQSCNNGNGWIGIKFNPKIAQ
jgi:sulfatase maturation enzyme AslB (radical SAM superfamily)